MTFQTDIEFHVDFDGDRNLVVISRNYDFSSAPRGYFAVLELSESDGTRFFAGRLYEDEDIGAIHAPNADIFRISLYPDTAPLEILDDPEGASHAWGFDRSLSVAYNDVASDTRPIQFAMAVIDASGKRPVPTTRAFIVPYDDRIERGYQTTQLAQDIARQARTEYCEASGSDETSVSVWASLVPIEPEDRIGPAVDALSAAETGARVSFGLETFEIDDWDGSRIQLPDFGYIRIPKVAIALSNSFDIDELDYHLSHLIVAIQKRSREGYHQAPSFDRVADLDPARLAGMQVPNRPLGVEIDRLERLIELYFYGAGVGDIISIASRSGLELRSTDTVERRRVHELSFMFRKSTSPQVTFGETGTFRQLEINSQSAIRSEKVGDLVRGIPAPSKRTPAMELAEASEIVRKKNAELEADRSTSPVSMLAFLYYLEQSNLALAESSLKHTEVRARNLADFLEYPQLLRFAGYHGADFQKVLQHALDTSTDSLVADLVDSAYGANEDRRSVIDRMPVSEQICLMDLLLSGVRIDHLIGRFRFDADRPDPNKIKTLLNLVESRDWGRARVLGARIQGADEHQTEAAWSLQEALSSLREVTEILEDSETDYVTMLNANQIIGPVFKGSWREQADFLLSQDRHSELHLAEDPETALKEVRRVCSDLPIGSGGENLVSIADTLRRPALLAVFARSVIEFSNAVPKCKALYSWIDQILSGGSLHWPGELDGDPDLADIQQRLSAQGASLRQLQEIGLVREPNWSGRAEELFVQMMRDLDQARKDAFAHLQQAQVHESPLATKIMQNLDAQKRWISHRKVWQAINRERRETNALNTPLSEELAIFDATRSGPPQLWAKAASRVEKRAG